MRQWAIAVCLVGACGGGGADPDAGGDAQRADARAPDALETIDAGPAADADPEAPILPTEPSVLSTGNATGQDEDPTILRALDGSMYAAWYSNRNGIDGNGRQDKEIFLLRSTDGVTWTDPPIQVTRSDEWSFYPSLAQSADGVFHLAWWRVALLPAGCTPGTDCTGTDNRIMVKSSADGVTWDLDQETVVADGPGDWLPSIVYDATGDRLLVYFAAVVRDAAGNTDLGESTTRLYRVIANGASWSAPERMAGLSPDTSHNTYPHVVHRNDNTLAMTWTRYDSSASGDPLQVIQEPTTDTMFAFSADGSSWSSPVTMSDGATAIDVFPQLYSDLAGTSWRVSWLTTALGGAKVVELGLGDVFPADVVERPELNGYTARVVATRTPGVYWGAWVRGADPAQFVEHRFFVRSP